jgi:hypothetical protein
MTSFQHSPSSSGGALPGAAAAAEADRLPLPSPDPVREGEASGRLAARTRWLDLLLACLVLALAFVLASQPARNSDVWLHLASGRLLAEGRLPLGADPFISTTAGARWVNHSWLSDGLAFVLFSRGGPAALLVAKALLLVLLAWVLLRDIRTAEGPPRGSTGWLAGVFTALSLVVVGSFVPLQPVCISFLLLGLTLWLIETRLATGQPSPTAWWPVPVLFALWVNLDEWFFLGPLTIGLYALGALLPGSASAGQRRALGLAFLAGLAACLLSPQHYHAFTLPAQLPFLAEAKTLREDPVLRRMFLSPFQGDYLRYNEIPHVGRLAYYPLILLGVVAFLLNARAARSGAAPTFLRRLPVWLGFLALSALDAWSVPFFAIVAGPVTALSFREYARRRAAELPAALSRRRALWAVAGRALTAVVTAGLLVAAWPGWLQGQIQEPRAWTVEIDSSLVAAVEELARWRQEGRLQGDESGFTFSFTVAHYLAWFAPQEKGFFDTRWRLCSAAANDYLTVRRALLGDSSAFDECRRIFRDRHLRYLVLHDRAPERTALVFQRLVNGPQEWPILFLQGDTVVLGWRDPALASREDPFADWRVDFHRRAFAPPEAERAPVQGPSEGPEPSPWRFFWSPGPAADAHLSDEAVLYLLYFGSFQPEFEARCRAAWESSLAAGAVAAPAPTLAARAQQLLACHFLSISRNGPRPRADGRLWLLDALGVHLAEEQRMQGDNGPPGLLFLAIRAARRAIRDNPNDAAAYRLLGEAYLHLARGTRERSWKQDLPSLAHIRQIQALVALHWSLEVQPEVMQTHADLVSLYQEMGMLDLALRHQREVLRLSRKSAPLAGVDGQAEQRLRQMEEAEAKLDEEVTRRLNAFTLQTVGRSVPQQVTLALSAGLADKALEVLLSSDVAVFGRQGAEIELDLLLTVGRTREASEWLSSLREADLGAESYHRLRILLEAARGNYEAAEEDLAEIAAPLERPVKAVFHPWKLSPTDGATPAEQPEDKALVVLATPQQVVSLKLGRLLLDSVQQRQTLAGLLQSGLGLAEFLERSRDYPARNFRRLADVRVLRGALALERGDVPQARSFLHEALAIWGSEAKAASGAGYDFGGRFAAQEMLKWLDPPPSAAQHTQPRARPQAGTP